jgi:hypothetical protein
MSTRYIKPARPDLVVRKPDRTVLAAAGETVTWTPYWQRRLGDGDVVEARSPAPSKSRTKAEE